MNNLREYNKKNEENITDKLLEYLYNSKGDTDELDVEVKPNEYSNSVNSVNSSDDIEEIKKDHATQLDKQLDNISNNIAIKFFELNDEKFKAVLDRIKLWGYELCLEEFITSYYLTIKKDNRLRQFVLIHLKKLVVRLKNIIEKQLITRMNYFSFTNADESELDELCYRRAEKEAELLNISPEKIKDDNTEEFVKTDSVAEIKEEILNELKNNNPLLEKGI